MGISFFRGLETSFMGLLVCSPLFRGAAKRVLNERRKKATKDEEMKDEQSEGFPSRWMIGKKVFFGRM